MIESAKVAIMHVERTGMVPPSRTYSGFWPHSASTARSARRNRRDSGLASYQSPTERRRTATRLAERSFRNSCSTCALPHRDDNGISSSDGGGQCRFE